MMTRVESKKMRKLKGAGSAVEEYEIVEVATSLLAQMAPRPKVERALAEQYSISDAAAKALVRRAEEQLVATLPHNVEQRRAEHVRRLEALYRNALAAKRHSVCERILRQLGEVHGVMRQVDQPHVPAPIGDNRWAGRTDAELDYYALNGHFPGEVSATIQLNGSGDPLEGLH